MAYSQGDKNVKMVLWEQMGTKMWKNGLFDIFFYHGIWSKIRTLLLMNLKLVDISHNLNRIWDNLGIKWVFSINAFVPNAPFLYPLNTPEKPYCFLMFSGGRERVHSEQMVKLKTFNKIDSQKLFPVICTLTKIYCQFNILKILWMVS